MYLTFLKKFARNNTACPCVLAQFFKKVKYYLFDYGRIFTFKFQRLSSRFLRVRLVRCFYVVLLCGLAPLPLLAEWGTNDSNKLNAILVELETIESRVDWTDVTKTYTNTLSIKNNVDSIDDNVSTAKNNLAYILHNLGYGVSSSQTGTISQDFSDVKSKLDSIIAALENLGDSGSSGSGGSGSTDITQDWVKETTFQDYSDNFNTYCNWLRDCLGYTGSSSSSGNGSLRSAFTELLYPGGTYGDIFRYYGYFDGSLGATSPFPNSYGTWGEMKKQAGYLRNSNNYMGILAELMAENAKGIGDAIIGTAKKASWNDWQAHTNLVATIVTQADRFFTQPTSDPSPTPSFNPSTGQMVTPSTGTGSADETITVSPSFTNDFAQIEQDTNTVTNNFAFVKEQEIRKRYFVEGILEVGEYRDYATLGSGFSDVIDIAGMIIDLNSQFANYRKIISSETLQTVRTIVGYLWHFLAIVASFFVVVKISGMSLSSGGDE